MGLKVLSTIQGMSAIGRFYCNSSSAVKKKGFGLLRLLAVALCKMPQLHLISWCRNFAEKHSFRIVLGDLSKTMQKLCYSTKFPHQEISEITIFYAVWDLDSAKWQIYIIKLSNLQNIQVSNISSVNKK